MKLTFQFLKILEVNFGIHNHIKIHKSFYHKYKIWKTKVKERHLYKQGEKKLITVAWQKKRYYNNMWKTSIKRKLTSETPYYKNNVKQKDMISCMYWRVNLACHP